MSQKPSVEIKYCCEYMKSSMEDPGLNAVHISETTMDKEISPFYMDVETNYGTIPCFLKYCPECGTQLSDHKWGV